ncbi:MAG: PA0069 family radical SAM protein [Pseudomonadota bacterium]
MEEVAAADRVLKGANGVHDQHIVHAHTIISDAGHRPSFARRRGRGAALNTAGRYETESRSSFDDGWETEAELAPFQTHVQAEAARSILTRNMSPDLPFDRSVNAYRGCEHGCAYCYARPSHANMGLSPGIDFESELFVKTNAATLLEREISKPGYECAPIAMGTNTDPYQPIERTQRVTRAMLEVLDAANHPVVITTKSALVLRDIDILASMAERDLVRVHISITTLDHKLSRALEPRASTPTRRLEALRKLTQAGIPASVGLAPIIPAINDHEIERIIDCAAAAGADYATYIMLRLPLEVAPIFKDWLLRHMPDRYNRVMSHVRAMRGGKDNSANFHERMRGDGPYAWQIDRRFQIQKKKSGLYGKPSKLRRDLFIKPKGGGVQLALI